MAVMKVLTVQVLNLKYFKIQVFRTEEKYSKTTVYGNFRNIYTEKPCI